MAFNVPSNADGDDDFFFHAARASAQLLGLVTDTQILDSTPHSVVDADMSVLVVVIHFRVGFGFISTLVELNDALLSLSTSFTSEWDTFFVHSAVASKGKAEHRDRA